MADFQNLDIYSIVTLVDRAGIGGVSAEFIYDGIRFPFVNEDGDTVTEKTVPQFVAEFIFATDKHRVWTLPTETAPTQYVNRYAIKGCSQKLLDLWGPEVGDTSPIVLNPNVDEGSDAPLYRTGPVERRAFNLPPAEQPRDRQGRRGVMVTGR